MTSRLDLNFSVSFNGVIWNMAALPANHLLIVEIRDEKKRQVSFSAWQYGEKRFLWENLTLDEAWWVGLLAAQGPVLLLQEYDGSGNPDRKTLLALDVETRALRWRKENFSMNALEHDSVTGFLGVEEPAMVRLDLLSGHVVGDGLAPEPPAEAPPAPLRPFQYLDGTPYFETVRDFLKQRTGVQPVAAVEYLEYNKMIIISYNIMEANGLAGYLLILDENGDVRMLEKTGEGLKGLGVDTFFILSGCLFFVRNKNELLSYQIL